MASDTADLTSVLGGRPVFAIEKWNTGVAMIALKPQPPYLLPTDYLDGERLSIYRVGNLDAGIARLKEDGWESGGVFEVPHGLCCSFRTPGGHRIAVYQPKPVLIRRPTPLDRATGRERAADGGLQARLCP